MSQGEEQSNEAWIELSAIVGPEHLRPARPEDAVDAVQPAGVIAPGTAQEVAQVLRYCASAGVSIIPRGGGTQLGLGNRPRKADFVLSLERLNRVIEHAWGDMTVTVEAGCTIDKLQSVVREHGQRLGADPMQPERPRSAACWQQLRVELCGSATVRFAIWSSVWKWHWRMAA